MAKTKISSTDLIWIIHEKLKEFEDHPLHGISIAIVPENNGEWRALTPHNVQARRRVWAERVDAIAKQLQKRYVLAGE